MSGLRNVMGRNVGDEMSFPVAKMSYLDVRGRK